MRKPIGIMPAILLVPTALSAMATQLYKSIELRDTTSSTKYPIANPHQGKFRTEVSRYLSNSYYTGNSSKAWYLLAETAPATTRRPSSESAAVGGCVTTAPRLGCGRFAKAVTRKAP